MKIFITLILLSTTFSANATSVLEDLIDLASALPSGGHYLNVRELNEQEIALEIEKRIAKKLEQITNTALKKKIAFRQNKLEQDLQDHNRTIQLYDKTNAAIKLALQLRSLIQQKLTNAAVFSENVQALLDTSNNLQSNLSILESLHTNLSQSKVNEPEFLLFSERLHSLASNYEFEVEEVSQLAISLEGDESLVRLEQMYFEHEFILKSFKFKLLSRKKQLEKRISLNETAINKLIGEA